MLDRILSVVQDQVIGILDWELSTLGNQMCDVAYSCMVLNQLYLIFPGISYTLMLLC